MSYLRDAKTVSSVADAYRSMYAKPNEDIPSGSAFLNFKKEYTYVYGDDWIIE